MFYLGAIGVAVVCNTALYLMIDSMRQMLGLMPVLLALNLLVVVAAVLLVWSVFQMAQAREQRPAKISAAPAKVVQGPWSHGNQAREA